MSAQRRRPDRRKPAGYWQLAQQPLHALVFVLPMLAFFHIGAAAHGSALLAPRHLQRVLGLFGVTAPFLPPVLIVVCLLAQHAARKDPWRIRPLVLGGMVIESVAWAAPLLAVSLLQSFVHAGSAGDAGVGSDPWRLAVAYVGAGVYEEFIFRMVLLGLVMLLFVDVLDLPQLPIVIVAILAGALLFGWYHPPASTAAWDTFPWSQFFFHASAGVLWGALYVYRGFGVAVGCHVAWNLYALAMS